jgi:hypothetical protein
MAVSYVPARFYSTIEGWPAATVHDHREVLDAFRRNASKAARLSMTKHIEHAGELLAIHIESGVAERGQLAQLPSPERARVTGRQPSSSAHQARYAPDGAARSGHRNDL